MKLDEITQGILPRRLPTSVTDSDQCEVFEEPNVRCINPATTIMEEPYTPGRFKIRTCDQCARYLQSTGYHNRGPIK
jgi:hypothetical protein